MRENVATSNSLREQHERTAWDEDRVGKQCHMWMNRVAHVTTGPNTRRGEERYEEILAAAAHGAHVLDVGCGHGEDTLELLRHEPAHVLGIDISAEAIASADEQAGGSECVEFRVGSAQMPITGRFDLVTGRAILHHIDFHEFLERAYRENLQPGGHMVFMEPMSHPLGIAFHKLVHSAHTSDERLLGRSDVAWLQRTFPEVRLYGINILSLPAGIVSSFLFSSPDNRLMRACDALDRRLLSIAPWLSTYARQAIIVIDKPRS